MPDFDFGLWTRAKDEELFDYTIEHFGTQGDRYLGGENLLQLLAFEVFSQNIDMCRNEGIPFAKPIEMINISSEVLGFVNDSQEARINQKLMMEKLSLLKNVMILLKEVLIHTYFLEIMLITKNY